MKFFYYCTRDICNIYVTEQLPTHNRAKSEKGITRRLREADKAYRECPMDTRRSKYAARVCRANIEHLETERYGTIKRILKGKLILQYEKDIFYFV